MYSLVVWLCAHPEMGWVHVKGEQAHSDRCLVETWQYRAGEPGLCDDLVLRGLQTLLTSLAQTYLVRACIATKLGLSLT